MSHQLWVFGSNGEGQLGEGIPPADIVSKPTLLPQLPLFRDIKAIRCGDNHTLFLLNDDSVIGIGDNRQGQLDPSNELEPRLVTGEAAPRITRFAELRKHLSICAAACQSSAFVDSHGGTYSTILTQGCGRWGELGRGSEEGMAGYDHSSITWNEDRLPGEVIAFAAGVWHYIAVLADGSVHGWGKARLGQLGERLRLLNEGKVPRPAMIEDIPFKPARVVCGKDFTYLVSESSTGEHTILGKDKFNIISGMPPDVKGWKDVGATWHSIFVLFDNGRLAAWGKENMWKLLPVDLPPIDKISVGSDHILALTEDGKLISWGWGKHGNCGDLTEIKDKVGKNAMISGFWNEITIPGQVRKIAAGYCTSFVITEVDEDEPSQN